jgi:hypothetical protein
MSAMSASGNTKLKEAFRKALGGGTAGALAMVIQTFSLMWMRTIINYQYRYGTTLREAAAKLYADGGILRFYRGIWWALVQAPLSRFGDTASNALLLNMLKESGMPVSVQTFCASMVAGLWRICLNPVDSFKTSMQVDGTTRQLREKIAKRGVLSLYDGAGGTYVATAVGHFPWFVTNNYFDKLIPKATTTWGRLCRSAFLGWISALVSDTVSNSVRVVKTVKQTSAEDRSYSEVARSIVEKEGVQGLLFRGLETKLYSNGVQSIVFSILWRHFEAILTKK